MAIQKKIKFVVLPLTDNSFEMVFIEVFNTHGYFVIGAAYIPPEYTVGFYENLLISVQTILNDLVSDDKKINFYFIGDFNVPGYEWSMLQRHSSCSGFSGRLDVREVSQLLNVWCKLYYLFQYNYLNNEFGNILDLCFSNNRNTTVNLCDEFIFECDSSHHPLKIKFMISQLDIITCTEKLFDFNGTNFSEIDNCINDITIPEIISIELELDKFLEETIFKFTSLIEKYVSVFYTKNKLFLSWFSNELKCCIFSKKSITGYTGCAKPLVFFYYGYTIGYIKKCL